MGLAERVRAPLAAIKSDRQQLDSAWGVLTCQGLCHHHFRLLHSFLDVSEWRGWIFSIDQLTAWVTICLHGAGAWWPKIGRDMSLARRDIFNLLRIKASGHSGQPATNSKLPSFDKTRVLCLLLHSCDISHPAKEWDLHYQWTARWNCQSPWSPGCSGAWRSSSSRGTRSRSRASTSRPSVIVKLLWFLSRR